MEIREGKPAQAGPYVAYVNGPLPGVAERVFLFWQDGRWCYPFSAEYYRDHVYGWIGPLPIMRLTADETAK